MAMMAEAMTTFRQHPHASRLYVKLGRLICTPSKGPPVTCQFFKQPPRHTGRRQWRLCTISSGAAGGGPSVGASSTASAEPAPSSQPRQQAAQQVPWGLGTVAAVMVTAWAGGGAAAFWATTKLLGPFGGQPGGGTVRGLLAWSLFFSSWHAALVLATLQLWVARYQPRRRGLFPLSCQPWRQWLLPLALGVGAIVAYFAWCAAEGHFFASTAMPRMLHSDWAAWCMELAAAAVVAPLYKELLFRGFLQPSLAKYLPPWLAVMLSAAAFALAHFNPTALADNLAFGMLYGVAYAWTQSLWPPIILHSLLNLGTVILTALF